ncbi:NAD kinase [Inhella gelatinilytica]|uniref:NAD kinase n=1 Tax=Inhella gelatinilytica TaxID=2795030 RepID=A0A931IUM9_9BURK|nr:NAD kinase [Inhella gelatinilytica]MBH9551309.1 NAD kinase [Inhella gelatinilytica]
MPGTRFNHVAIVAKHQAPTSGPLVEQIRQFLRSQGLQVSLERQSAESAQLAGYPVLDTQEIGRLCDLVVVAGGDGTMLGLAREIAPFGVPLVGINQGRLGFITDIPADQFREALEPILAGDFETEQRTMLEGAVWRDRACIFSGLALNDVVVSRGAAAGMVELRIHVGEEFVANIRADGVIVASPTGSTAYSMSAGGPLLHPSIGGWVMVPIASHGLSNRPIVLPDTGVVSLEIVAGRDASVNFDMQSLTHLHHGDRVTVTRSQHRSLFLHPKGWSYYATLRRKLGWYEG